MHATFGSSQTVSFLKQYLELPHAHILDVGAGKGDVGALLAAEGAEVYAIDSSAKAVAAAKDLGRTVHQISASSLSLNERFDAALLSMSAHHIHPLGDCLENVKRHLKPDGLIIFDELAVEECDEASAKWYYDTLAAVGDAPEGWPENPLEIWKRDHAGDHHRFNTGSEMKALVMEKFVVRKVERGPYFYRYLGRTGNPSQEKLFSVEKRLIESGRIRPLGLRIVASKA